LFNTSNTKFYHLNYPSKDKDNQLQKKCKKLSSMLGGYHKQKYTLDDCDFKRNQTLLQYVAKLFMCVIIF
jgi:hypothetical protein